MKNLPGNLQDSVEKQLQTIVSYCDNMQANETLDVLEFGKNKDLLLHIQKDTDYQPDMDPDAYNIVSISTKQNNEFIDDTGDVHVTDGSLYQEVKRIWNYRNLQTL